MGRNLQGHAYPEAFGIFDRDTFDDLGPGASIAICDYNHGNPGLVGGAMLANEFIRLPYQFTGMRPPRVPRWGKAHKDYMRDAFRRTIAVMGPVAGDARLRLPGAGGSRREGFPGASRWRGSRARTTPTRSRWPSAISRKAEEWVKKAGAIETWRAVPGRGLCAGQHQAGTCRMGKDPRTSVVDPGGRVHDLGNLFVADASVHVTNGGFNPALTILANGYRTAAGIVKGFRAGGYR